MITNAQDLGGNTLVTMLEIDFSTCVAFKPTGTSLIRISSNRNGVSNIVYNGNTYEYVGFDVQGFRSEINGQPPAPTITFDKASLISLASFISLWDEYTSQTGQDYFDPRGAKVTIFRTSNLSTLQQTTTQEFVVAQSSKITSSVIEWQLAVSLGIDRANSDSVTKLAVNRCNLRYRRWNATTNTFDYTPESEGGCPYGNPTTVSNWSAVPDFGNKYYTNEDAELLPANKNLDKCSYSAKGCQLRFDPAENGLTLPFVMLYSPNIIGRN